MANGFRKEIDLARSAEQVRKTGILGKIPSMRKSARVQTALFGPFLRTYERDHSILAV